MQPFQRGEDLLDLAEAGGRGAAEHRPAAGGVEAHRLPEPVARAGDAVGIGRQDQPVARGAAPFQEHDAVDGGVVGAGELPQFEAERPAEQVGAVAAPVAGRGEEPGIPRRVGAAQVAAAIARAGEMLRHLPGGAVGRVAGDVGAADQVRDCPAVHAVVEGLAQGERCGGGGEGEIVQVSLVVGEAADPVGDDADVLQAAQHRRDLRVGGAAVHLRQVALPGDGGHVAPVFFLRQ